MTTTKRNVKTEEAMPAFRLGDLTPLATQLRRLRELNEHYDRAIVALIAARRVERGWDAAAAPELPLTVERQMIALTGTADELAQFDAEHGAAMRAEQDAAAQQQRAVAAAPEVVAAIEKHAKGIAKQMIEEVNIGAIQLECERLFLPAAQRMLDAARAFVDAWCSMNAVAAALASATTVRESNVYGETFGQIRFRPLGPRRDDDLLPTHVAGASVGELMTLNQRMGRMDAELYDAVRAALVAEGLGGKVLTIYRPGSDADERHVYAEDPNPPERRPNAPQCAPERAGSVFVAGVEVTPLPGSTMVADVIR